MSYVYTAPFWALSSLGEAERGIVTLHDLFRDSLTRDSHNKDKLEVCI